MTFQSAKGVKRTLRTLTVDEHVTQVDNLTNKLEEGDRVPSGRTNGRRHDTMRGGYDGPVGDGLEGCAKRDEKMRGPTENGRHQTFAEVDH